jgi:predicted Zn-dependent protease
MSAACSLRAGQAAVEANRIDAAKELLRGILERYPHSDYAFYTLQAKALLSELEPESVQVSLNRP